MKKIVCCFLGFGMLFCACSSKYAETTVEEVVDEVEYALDEDYSSDDDFMEEKEYVANNSNISYCAVTNDLSSKKENTKKTSKYADESFLLKKKIIKDGNIIVQSKDIEASKNGFDNLLKSLNAYYERENLKKTSYRISYDLIIRVPAGNFEHLLSSVEQGKDEVKSKNIRARDVTEEYVDITIRLDSKREYLKQYTVLLAKANTIKDILEIKENIRQLHEEIERAEGRLRYLNDQVAFSTLTVELYQEIDYVYKPAPQDSFIERVKLGLNTGWKIVVEIVVFLIHIWSILLLLIVAFFFVRRHLKKQKKQK